MEKANNRPHEGGLEGISEQRLFEWEAQRECEQLAGEMGATFSVLPGVEAGGVPPIPDLSKGIFTKPLEGDNFIRYDGKRKASKAAIESLGGYPVTHRESEWHRDSGYADFEAVTGTEVEFYEGDASDAGFTLNGQGTERTIFVNVRSPREQGWTLAHEWAHVASHDPDSGFDEVAERVWSLLGEDDIAVFRRQLRAGGYGESSDKSEVVAYLAGDAISGFDYFGLEFLAERARITAIIRDFYSQSRRLNPVIRESRGVELQGAQEDAELARSFSLLPDASNLDTEFARMFSPFQRSPERRAQVRRLSCWRQNPVQS